MKIIIKILGILDFVEFAMKNRWYKKVRDHCHITGKYRGAAHSQCNLKLKIPKKLPIIFHNLEGYDGHIIFKELNNFDNIDIQVIPKSSEKCISNIINNSIVLLDSLQFYKGALDSDFKHLMSEFTPNKLEILRKKDAYPNEWVDSYEKRKFKRITKRMFSFLNKRW